MAHDDDDLSGSGDSLERLLRAAKPTPPRGLTGPLEGVRLADGRIEVLRRLGSGAMGTVYEARDRGTRVALKTLNNLSPNRVYQLKKEFRLLASVTHPNVVSVYGLFAEQDAWFFTMEPVAGLPLDRFWAIRPQSTHDDAQSSALSPSDIELLRDLFRQITEGVIAIHAAGLLHRDLKPTNVMVEAQGRVVILDFGLVSDQLPGGVGQTVEHAISGTPGFMAPEQAVGAAATTASDWYAVGVMLYLLLTRRLPHTGSVSEVLRNKQHGEVIPPIALAAEVPPDLNDLCCQLLRWRPEERPTGEQMLAVTRSWTGEIRALGPSEGPVRSASRFVGRQEALAQLEKAFVSARSGYPVLTVVRAESGMGKSALLNHFVDHLQRSEDVFVLRGRCYEREAVPYKAFDEVIDDLTRILLRLSEEQVTQLIPRHVHTLARLFPVLLRVEVFRRAAEGRAETPDAQVPRLGFAAFREMLCRISDRRPLVLLIDDLQWADIDSVRLLAEVLAPPDAPSVLVIGSHRAEVQDSPIVRELGSLEHIAIEHIELGPLERAEAAELARSALAAGFTQPELEADRIADESEGIPLYVLELTRSRQLRQPPGQRASLQQLLQRRIAELPEAARTMLELAAVTGRPLSREIVSLACRNVSYPVVLAALRAAKLVHTAGRPQEEAMEPAHDRVRLAVLAKLDRETLIRHHVALAEALEATGDAEPEWVAQHLAASGQTDKAQHYVLRAAEQAMEVLAFHRAADLFALALDLAPGDGAPPNLYRRLGDALSRSGRGAEAADAYVAAARRSGPAEALALEALAASQWLRVGYLAEAVKLLRDALSRNGLRWPESVPEAAARLLLARARVHASGLKFTLREESQVPVDLLHKLDALYPAQTALGTFDYLRGACFASTALPLALKAGEPRRLVTALATEAVYGVMLDGLGSAERARRIRDSIESVSERIDDSYGEAVAQLTAALCAYWSGEWSKVVAPALRAEALFSQRVAGGTWEAALVRSVRHTVLVHSGGLPQLCEESPTALLEATDRNDRYAELDLLRSMIAVRLCEDAVPEATKLLERIDALLERFPLISLNHLVMSANVSLYLYAGEPRMAFSRLRALWLVCKKMALHRLPLLRVNYAGMLADCIRADHGRREGERAQELSRLSRQVAHERVAWAAALAGRIEAFAAQLRGDRALAARSLERASEQYQASGLLLDAAVARFEQSGLVSAARGRELREEALAYLHAQGITRPERWARLVDSLY